MVMFWQTLRSLKGCNSFQYPKLDTIWVHLTYPNLGSPGQVEVPETTSSFSQVVKALVKP